VEKNPRTEKTIPKEEPKITPEVNIRKKYSDSLERIFPPTLKESYNICVLLPLYLDQEDRDLSEQTPVTVSQEFYKGLLVAADTLNYCGKRFKINIIDSEKKGMPEKTIYDSIKSLKTDLIMGPVLDSRLYRIDSFSKVNKINRVSPITVTEKCFNNPFYFESLPSSQVTGRNTGEYVKRNYNGYKIILVINDDIENIPVASSFVSAFNKGEVSIISFKGKSASTYTPEYNLGEKNYIFIPSKNESYVSAVLSQLRLKEQEIVVGGLFNWTYFKGIEGDLWEKLHVTLPSPYLVDYESNKCDGFIKSYRAKFNEEPTIWAFIGFDEMIYYGQLLQSYGKYFQIELEASDKEMLHTNYRMRHDKDCDRWRNTYINFLKFENYSLRKSN